MPPPLLSITMPTRNRPGLLERALVGAIGELLDDPERRRRMGQAGRERVRAALSWEHSAPVLLAVYDRLWPAPGGAAMGNGSRRPGDGGGPGGGRELQVTAGSATAPGRDSQRRPQGHQQPGRGAAQQVGQRVHLVDQAGHGDDEHIPAGQPGDDEPTDV